MTDNAEAPTIGHNSKSVLELIEEEPGVVYDSPALLDDLLAEIDRAIEEHPIDLSTDKGRKAIASLAASISRRKTSIEEAGKARTEEWRAKTASVNAIKRKAEDELSARRDKARKPLTDWEAEEKARGERIVQTIERIERIGVVPPSATVENIDEAIESLKGIEITDAAFGEYAARAQAAWRRSHAALTDARPMIEQREREQAELAELRKEREARQAEETRKAAAEAKEREIEAARAEAAEKAAAAERARIAQEQAANEAAEARAKEAADRLARDFQHRQRIEDDVLDALTTGHALVSNRAIAKRIFSAIAEGKVPHVSIKF